MRTSSSFRRPLLIWDIDGTLLEPRGIGRAALNDAFAAVHGVECGFDGLDFAGATDHDLYRQAVLRAFHDVSGMRTNPFFSQYIQMLHVRLEHSPLKPLPGVATLIPCLSAAGWRLALGTGNIRAGAYSKLNAAGLSGYFPGGGFSSPSQSRAELLDAARRQGGVNDTAIIIGDTPRDIEAAHQIAAPAIAVATGRFSASDLNRLGADAVLVDLTDSRLLLNAIHAVIT